MRKSTVKSHKRSVKGKNSTKVRTHTRTTKKSNSPYSEKAVVGGLLRLSSDMKAQYGEEGIFPHADGFNRNPGPT